MHTYRCLQNEVCVFSEIKLANCRLVEVPRNMRGKSIEATGLHLPQTESPGVPRYPEVVYSARDDPEWKTFQCEL